MKLDAAINTWVRNKDKEKEPDNNNKDFSSLLDKLSQIPGFVEAEGEEGENVAADPFDTVLENLGQIDGFNVDTIVTKFGGISESIETVLRSFIKNTPPLLDKLREVTADTLADYAVIVHGVKGSSRSIAAEDVGTDAEALELAAKRGDIGFVEANNEALLHKTEHLIEALKTALDGASGSRELAASPDKALLDELLAASLAFDVDSAEEILLQLEAFDYEEGGDLVVWLREQFDIAGFKKIANKLRE
jgi:HPt (histidine-containing phosphotransfer) domain-containing protein